ncbi:hypothetical protein COCNU_scaffold003579G000010 [Cocos nucifera]|nr:hypothetical protein [Cocos nucifera]
MEKKKREEEERKREEEKKVEEEKEEKKKREYDKKKGEEKKMKHEDKRKRWEQNKKIDVGDKPKTLMYSLERRVKKEHQVHKTFYLIEDPNYATYLAIKKSKTVPKSKKVLLLNLSNISSKQQNEEQGFIKHSREYQGKGLLSKEEDASIKIFLIERITFEIVFNNAEGGSITRSNIHDLLFARIIIDDVRIQLFLDLNSHSLL